jgi:hypothetical protein
MHRLESLAEPLRYLSPVAAFAGVLEENPVIVSQGVSGVGRFVVQIECLVSYSNPKEQQVAGSTEADEKLLDPLSIGGLRGHGLS